jgi:hypothetical protein
MVIGQQTELVYEVSHILCVEKFKTLNDGLSAMSSSIVEVIAESSKLVIQVVGAVRVEVQSNNS